MAKEKKKTTVKKLPKMKKEKDSKVRAKEAGKEVSEKHECNDIKCPFHGKLKTRGRIFEGIVVRKFPKRITIEFERSVYIRKYERYMKKKTRIHARLPDCQASNVNIGDIVQVQECRPLSKLIHHVFIKKIKDASEK